MVVVLSVAGNAIWLYEINNCIGWHSLAWLHVHLVSPYIIALFTVSAFILPLIFKNKINYLEVLLAVSLLYLTSIILYKIGKDLCFFLYRFMAPPVLLISILVVSCIVVFFILGFTYWAVSNRLLVANKKRNIILIAIMGLLSIPAAWATVYILPGFGCCNDWVDAVKMGYPVFWITLLLGISSIIIARKTA